MTDAERALLLLVAEFLAERCDDVGMVGDAENLRMAAVQVQSEQGYRTL